MLYLRGEYSMPHVAFNFDHRYLRHWAVTLTSLLANYHGESRLTVHALTLSLTPDDVSLARGLAESLGADFRHYAVNPDKALSFRVTSKGLSPATFLRLFVAELLPADVDKVLYLDCDVVARHAVDELLAVPVDGYALAAVPDLGGYDGKHFQRLLSHAVPYPYFNAGVMLINLRYWRRHKVAERALSFYRENESLVRFEDQDLLNAVLEGRVLWLDVKWNALQTFYRKRHLREKPWLRASAASLADPSILHFAATKPWLPRCSHPMRGEYLSHERLLPPPLRPSRLRRAARSLGHALCMLPYLVGLQRRRYLSPEDIRRRYTY